MTRAIVKLYACFCHGLVLTGVHSTSSYKIRQFPRKRGRYYSLFLLLGGTHGLKWKEEVDGLGKGYVWRKRVGEKTGFLRQCRNEETILVMEVYNK